MKHELTVPESDRIHRLVARETLRFCSSKEYTESEFDFPVVFGRDERGEPIIVDLPSLGNTVIYGSTGGPSFYEGIFLAQMLWAKHPKSIDIDVFDFPIGMSDGVCAGHGQYATGAEDGFGAFLEKIRTAIEKRKTGEVCRTQKVFFAHILSAKPKNLNRNTLNDILKEDLKKLGLQFILCGETSAAASYLKNFADMFDTAIELETAYTSNKLYGIIRTGGRCPKNSFARRYVYLTDLSCE